MNFYIDDQVIRAGFVQKPSIISKHTGNQLLCLDIEFPAYGEEENNLAHKILRAGRSKGLVTKHEDGAIADKWRITDSRESYTLNNQSQEVHTHTWKLVSYEELFPTKLIIGNIELSPHKYREEFQNQGLHIEVCANLDAQATDAFRELEVHSDYFPVVRMGINETARKMRFGQTIWSETEIGTRYHFILVDESFDEGASGSANKGALEPVFTNLRGASMWQAARFNELINVLNEKVSLTDDEVKSIKDPPEKRRFEHLFIQTRVRDADEWFDD